LTDAFNRDNQLDTKSMTASLLISGPAIPVAGVTTGTTVATCNGAEFQLPLLLPYSANRTQKGSRRRSFLVLITRLRC